jgi:hypothetical protein
VVTSPFDWQPRALAAFRERGGAFIAMGLGRGKTYFGAQVYQLGGRPLWIGPASSKKGVFAAFEKQGLPPPEFVSFSALGVLRGVDLLDDRVPDVVVIDEVHKAKNVRGSAVGRRLARYLAAHPATRVLAMSGTIVGRKLIDWAPPLHWALRGEDVRRIVPASYDRLAAMSERLEHQPDAYRALLERLRGVPGVFLDDEESWGGAVTFEVNVRLPAESEEYRRAAREWVLPDGSYIGTALEAQRVIGQLARGFWYRPVHDLPEEYTAARAAWLKTVRRGKMYSLGDSDAELRRVYPEAWAAWRAVADRYPEPETAPVFYDDRAMRLARQWSLPLIESSPGIVWVKHIELGAELSRRLGWLYFREEARDASGIRIDEYAPSRAETVLASIDACGTGLNLQQFGRNLFLELPDNAELMHQAIGRTARSGQERDEVTVEVWCPSPEDQTRLEKFAAEAADIERRTGQKRFLARLSEHK